MRPIALDLAAGSNALFVGAHPDDIEIGCGGSILRWVRERSFARVDWVVFSGGGSEREAEARSSAAAFLDGVAGTEISVLGFRDGFLPADWAAVKEQFESLKARTEPDLILTHRRDDAHQDHRLLAELTWNTFRDHLILEYEIPKYEGDLGAPNVFVEVPDWAVQRKIELLMSTFGSQARRAWFTPDLFRAVLTLRGIESRAASGFAEGLDARKLVIREERPAAAPRT